MAPRNQSKKILSLEERSRIADIKEETKAIQKQKKEDKNQAVIDKRIARRQAKLDKLANPEAIHEPKSEANPDVIVIDD
jgi:hypothetical protein